MSQDFLASDKQVTLLQLASQFCMNLLPWLIHNFALYILVNYHPLMNLNMIKGTMIIQFLKIKIGIFLVYIDDIISISLYLPLLKFPATTPTILLSFFSSLWTLVFNMIFTPSCKHFFSRFSQNVNMSAVLSIPGWFQTPLIEIWRHLYQQLSI